VELTKSELRSMIRHNRAGQKFRFEITPLLSTREFRDAEVVASYRSYGDEPDTALVNESILANGKILLLPKLLPDMNLEFIQWDGSAELQSSQRVEFPLGRSFIGKIDLVIIPSLAVDKKGHRLGQGGGSYDRALSTLTAWRVAMINESELLESIPVEVHDMPVNAALLPDRLVRF
jgi:5-formyltetrahydrofolate cyclo-ligase